MPVNFDVDCNEFEGAERPVPEVPKMLKPEELECYAEGAYEASLDYDLKKSEAILKELESQKQKILNGDEEKRLVGRIQDNSIIRRVKISASGIEEVSALPGTPNSLNSSNLSNFMEPVIEDGITLRTHRHPNTVRKYIGLLLTFFNNIETEYVDNEGNIFTRKLPVIYASREKLLTIGDHEFEALANGNTNKLPRASLVIDSIQYSQNRQLNKTLNTVKQNSPYSLVNGYSETVKSPSPYDISVRLTLVTRGINDALMIAEQIGSRFNPFMSLKIYEDPLNANQTDVRVMLEGITFEPPEIDEFSQNEVVSEFSFIISGNLYSKPGKEYLIDSIHLSYSL